MVAGQGTNRRDPLPSKTPVRRFGQIPARFNPLIDSNQPAPFIVQSTYAQIPGVRRPEAYPFPFGILQPIRDANMRLFAILHF